MKERSSGGRSDLVAERVIPADLGVAWSAGAPVPVLLMDESRAVLLFELAEGNEEGLQTAIVEWIGCASAKLGFPNDEVQHGHQLWRESGTEPPYYEAVEVLNSTWIAELARIERVHERAGDDPFGTYRHFVLLFHDSTFECVSRDFRVAKLKATVEEALTGVVRELAEARSSPNSWPHSGDIRAR